MHVFVTGASGWVGSAVVADLLGDDHRVTGLCRSDEKAFILQAMGAQVLRGTLDDPDVLREGASGADAVIHTAFDHDFSRFTENAEQDRRVIETIGTALEGSDRPLLVTSGLSGLVRGATETDGPAPNAPRRSEAAAGALARRGVRVATVRLAPSVHGLGENSRDEPRGFIPLLIRLARESGVSAYLGDGSNCWSGVHRLDVARLYRLVLKEGVTRPTYHAVADEAVPFKAIATVIGRRLDLPVEQRERSHFGWFADLAGMDMAASSAWTRAVTGWEPVGPDLLSDINHPGYYEV